MMMINAVPQYGYQNYVTEHERKLDEKVFADAQRSVKKSEVRNADWGLYAAQNCLARDLVNASPEEVGLIMDKMNFLQGKINDNLKVDSEIYGDKVRVKSDAAGSKAELVRAYSDATTGVMNSTGRLVKDVAPSVINLVA